MMATASAVDLTFATVCLRIVIANVKSKTALELYCLLVSPWF